VNEAEQRWCLVLKTLEKRYENFAAESLEAKSAIDFIHVTLNNIMMLRHVSLRLNMDAADWLRIMEEAEET
jgi:hypothetical protein